MQLTELAALYPAAKVSGRASCWGCALPFRGAAPDRRSVTHVRLILVLQTSSASTAPPHKAWHFDVDASRNRLDFSWRLRPGTSEAGHYGLALARAVGFPPDVMQAAEEVVAGG